MIDELDKDFESEFQERQYVCPICKKKFRLPMFMSRAEYVYVLNIYNPSTKRSEQRKCCSYTCWRKGKQK